MVLKMTRKDQFMEKKIDKLKAENHDLKNEIERLKNIYLQERAIANEFQAKYLREVTKSKK